MRRFRGSFGRDRTAKHFGTYCRGLLSNLPRKSIEPIALEAGTAVRTLQEFLVTARWDQAAACDTLQKHLGAAAMDFAGENREFSNDVGMSGEAVISEVVACPDKDFVPVSEGQCGKAPPRRGGVFTSGGRPGCS